MGVLPDIFSTHDKVAAKRLLYAGVELVAEPRRQRGANAWNQALNHRIVAAFAGENKVLVEGRFQRARIGGAKNGIGLFHFVTQADARFRLPGDGEPVVNVAANA